MTFPQVPLDVVTELYVNNGWTDITGDVYARDDISITQGRRNEGASVDPCSCTLTLDNRSGNYSPRNPMGAYYGSLGRNTPIRVSVRMGKDSFARTVSGGWGTADTGQAWAQGGNGGTVSASDFAVNGTAGTHSVPATNARRYTYQASEIRRDVDVAVTVSLPFSSVTGGSLFPAEILLRAVDEHNFYLVRPAVNPDSSITIAVALVQADGVHLIGSAITTDYLFSGQPLRVRAQAEGSTIRAKIWPDGSPEPFAWQVSVDDDTYFMPGFVGIRSVVDTANTNTLPVVFSYRNFELRTVRFTGEVSSWPAKWDMSGTDVYVPIEASGILRRLGQAASVLQSAMRRSIPDLGPQLVAYWPCEDGKNATTIASGLSGGAQARFPFTGPPDFAAFNTFAASDPIPTLKISRWDLDVPRYAGTGQAQVRFLMNVPDNGSDDQVPLVHVWCRGGSTAQLFELVYLSGGGLKLQVYDGSSPTPITSTGAIAFNVNGKLLRMSLELSNTGSDVTAKMATLEVGQVNGLVQTLTVTGRTIDTCNTVIVNPWIITPSPHQQVSIGHITVESKVTSLFDLSSQLNAYRNESAIARMIRLCGEEGVPFSYIARDSVVTSPNVGFQNPDTLLSLVNGAAASDMGTLYEGRSSTGLLYRRRSSLYNQASALDLSYSQVSAPFEPVDDDQHLRNDVTVTRQDGASYNAVQTTGPLSVNPPPNGVGRYDQSITLSFSDDSQVVDAASWLLHLGTTDEARYPTVTVDLAASTVSANPAIERGLMDLSVDDRFTISNLPAWLPPETLTLLALGYAESIGPFTHTVTINSAPESPYHVTKLDTDLVDTDGAHLVSAIGTTDSTVTVEPSQNVTEGFEDSALALTTRDGGDVAWSRTTLHAHSGSFSMRSGAIGNSQTSDLIITVPPGARWVSFWYKLSTELSHDFFRFLLDTAENGFNSGNVDWTFVAPIDVSGVKTITLRYQKDASGVFGDDAVFIDDFAFTYDRLWTTTAAPFDIMVGGERMTVTAVAGTSNPQTMTVTRSVNGIVKGHPAGTEVDLFRPSILAW